MKRKSAISNSRRSLNGVQSSELANVRGGGGESLGSGFPFSSQGCPKKLKLKRENQVEYLTHNIPLRCGCSKIPEDDGTVLSTLSPVAEPVLSNVVVPVGFNDSV